MQLFLGLGVSALAVFFLLQAVPLDRLGQILGQAQPGWVIGAALFTLFQLLVRALRWQAYFKPERNVRLRPLLSTLAISYMASTFLPFRGR